MCSTKLSESPYTTYTDSLKNNNTSSDYKLSCLSDLK